MPVPIQNREFKASKTITHNGSASYATFTVTGTVAVRCVGRVTTALSNVAATTSVGTATSAAGLIAATAGTAMQTVDQLWVDTGPSKFEPFPTAYSAISENIVTDGDATLAAGVVEITAYWFPISPGSTLVA